MGRELIKIYCPECKKNGRKKLLCKVEKGTTGKLYLWCKEDKQEIVIQLNKEPLSLVICSK